MRQSLAQAIGAFAAGVRFDRLPAQAVAIAKTGITDCIGVIVAGSAEPPPQILRRALASDAGQAGSTILGAAPGARAPAAEAAWINGTAGHVLDYDDVAIGHPSVVIVPALLAEGETLDARGTDLIAAYVAGYEVWMELVLRERGNHQVKGWHPTALLGALAAAAACASLRRLTAEQSMHALGIAAAQAGGITASYGTMAKSFQVGRAAHAGVLAARLAGLGMTASPDVLDHPRGLLKVISQEGDVDIERNAEHLGVDWHICRHGLNIKRYPICYCAHRTIDAVLNLRERARPQPGRVARIEASLSDIHATILVNHFPESSLAAKFSVEFAIAAALLEGEVGWKQLDETFVKRDDVRDLMRKVSVTTNRDYDPDEPAFSMHDQVRVFMDGGEVIDSGKVRYARGNARLPLTSEELERKFLDCMRVGGVAPNGEALLELLRRLETLQSCRALMQTAVRAA